LSVAATFADASRRAASARLAALGCAVDERLLLSVNGLRGAWVDGLVSVLGEWGVYAFPAAMLALALARPAAFAAMARDGWLAWLLAFFVAEILLKPLVGRPRPTALPELLAQLRVLGPVPPARSLSMPSGSAAMASAGAVWLWRHGRSRALGWGAVVTAAAISVGRVVAGLHWPSDVAAGGALGVVLALAVERYGRWAAR